MKRNNFIPTLKLANWEIDITSPKVQQYFDAAKELDNRINKGELNP
ncbi:MAG: hypothetical protein WDZ47_08290 [Bacteroidales bacterium]